MKINMTSLIKTSDTATAIKLHNYKCTNDTDFCSNNASTLKEKTSFNGDLLKSTNSSSSSSSTSSCSTCSSKSIQTSENNTQSEYEDDQFNNYDSSSENDEQIGCVEDDDESIDYEKHSTNFNIDDLLTESYPSNEAISYLNFSSYCNRNLNEKQIRELFYNDYLLGREIGKGGFGIIFGAIRKKDNQSVAIKVIKKSKITQWYDITDQELNEMNVIKQNTTNNDILTTTRIPLEIALMIRVRHVKSCIKIYDYLEQKNCFIIVMERIESSKDLFDYITDISNSSSPSSNSPPANTFNNNNCCNIGYGMGISENQAKNLFKQIVESIVSIYKLGVLHRDIKDENILIDVNTNKIKIIDFGAGTFIDNNNNNNSSNLNRRRLLFHDFHGTRVYSPPEWILNKCYYGDRATVWSLGVLLFNMIYGDIPWEEDNDIINCRLYAKVKTNSSSSSNDNNNKQRDVDDLIKLCLTINDSNRIKLNQILRHKWFNNTSDCTSSSSPSDTDISYTVCNDSTISSSSKNKHTNSIIHPSNNNSIKVNESSSSSSSSYKNSSAKSKLTNNDTNNKNNLTTNS